MSSSSPLCPKCVERQIDLAGGLDRSALPEVELEYDEELDKLVCDGCGYVW